MVLLNIIINHQAICTSPECCNRTSPTDTWSFIRISTRIACPIHCFCRLIHQRKPLCPLCFATFGCCCLARLHRLRLLLLLITERLSPKGYTVWFTLCRRCNRVKRLAKQGTCQHLSISAWTKCHKHEISRLSSCLKIYQKRFYSLPSLHLYNRIQLKHPTYQCSRFQTIWSLCRLNKVSQ